MKYFPDSKIAEEAIENADRFRRQKNFSKAHGALRPYITVRRLLSLSNRDLSALHFAQSQVYYGEGNEEKNKSHLKESLRQDSLNINARITLCEVYIRARDFQPAINLLEETWTTKNEDGQPVSTFKDGYAPYATGIKAMAAKVERHIGYYLEDLGGKAKDEAALHLKRSQEISDDVLSAVPHAKATKLTKIMAYLFTEQGQQILQEHKPKVSLASYKKLFDMVPTKPLPEIREYVVTNSL